MVAYLNKSDASKGFNQVNDFLNGSYIKYALTVNPNIYVSCIKQFWNTVVVKQTNDVTRLQTLVDRKKVVITEAAIRDVLRLDDAEGVDCLPNEEIFAELARMADKEEEKKEEEVKDDQVQGRQAKIYKIDMDHALKVLKVVTAASETITASSTTISAAELQVPAAVITTAAPVRVAAASTRRRKGVVIIDPEEESSTIIPADTKSKDKGKGIMVEESKPMKKKQQVEMDEEYARKLHEELWPLNMKAKG
nr:xylulose kinase-1 [Tanacetum cinerariifolium]